MKVTYNWLKDFVEIKITPQALAEKLTMAGLEVTALEEKQGDYLFEIEVTSNRPDCLSVIGIAREVAAITGKKFRVAKSQLGKVTNSEDFKISIENKKDCPFYSAKIIRNVKVGPSPEWLRKRLELIACRSVNNIVDVTNYILFETGQPLHAFDLDKLSSGTISVRRAKNKERLAVIDGQEKTLNPELLVIADREEPLALAGVMGGKDSEVCQETKNILLEAAIFDPILVRHSRQGLGLSSESAYRFERGINPEMVEYASWRAVSLIEELTGAKCSLAKHSGGLPVKKKNIALELSLVNKILGTRLSGTEIKKILGRLGFNVRIRSKNKFNVQIPSTRADIVLDIDLIEEIARIYGYASIPKSLPQVRPQPAFNGSRELVSLTKNILIALGLNEVITYSLIPRSLLKNFPVAGDFDLAEIANPLSREQEVLRPTILPSLASSVAYNFNQKQTYVAIFEIAEIFFVKANLPHEEQVLGIALGGNRTTFLEEIVVKEKAGFLHLKGTLEKLFKKLGIKNYNFLIQASNSVDIFINEAKIGSMLRLSQEALGQFEIKNKDVFLAEISLEKLFMQIDLEKKFVPLPRYPGISRDISFVLKEETRLKDVLAKIKEKGKPFLSGVEVSDYYKGRQIPAGFRGLTVSCLYRSQERTLTEAEINPIDSSIRDLLIKQFKASIR